MNQHVEGTGQPQSETLLPEPKKSKKKLFITVGAAAGVLLIGGITAGISTAVNTANKTAEAAERAALAEQSELRRAVQSCVTMSSHYELLDDFQAVSMDGVGKYYGAGLSEVHCVLHRIGAPASIETKLGNTRSLDGTREETWENYSAEWTYHPDDGLNILIERDNQVS